MALTLSCPSCGQPLRVARDFPLAELICPRCLAPVASPGSEAAAPAPAPRAAGTPPQSPEAESRPAPVCPGCGRPTQAPWVICPYCEEPLRAPPGAADVRWRRAERRTGCGVIALTVVGGLGLLYGIVGTLIEGFEDREWGPLVVVLLALLVLAGVSTVITLVRGKGDPNARGVRRIVRGTLALAGLLILVGALLGLAAFAYVFAVCLAGGGRF